MWPWAHLLGGLSIWAIHFMGVYAIASVFALSGSAERAAAMGWIIAFSLACLLANGALAYRIMRPGADPHGRWRRSLGLLGVAFSSLAILWQALPALLFA